jgi:hypothetical protein
LIARGVAKNAAVGCRQVRAPQDLASLMGIQNGVGDGRRSGEKERHEKLEDERHRHRSREPAAARSRPLLIRAIAANLLSYADTETDTARCFLQVTEPPPPPQHQPGRFLKQSSFQPRSTASAPWS